MSTVGSDPWSTGIMAGASVAEAALKPGMAQGAANYSSLFDDGGMTVNVGAGSAKSSSSKTADPISAVAGGLLKNPMLMLILGAIAIMMLKKK